MIKDIIIATIQGEEHLGVSLKNQCIDYIEKLDHNWNELKKFLEDEYEKLHGSIYSTNAVFLRNDDLLIKMDTVNKILNKISELEEENK